MRSGAAEAAAVREMLGLARVLIFDFDGTLVDSNPVKRRAFESCFREFPDQLPEILNYCQSNTHMPRGDKFRHVYDQILKRPYPSDAEGELHSRFEAATTEQIIRAPEIPHAEEFLRSVRNTHRAGLLSCTPQEVILEILSRRGWRDYFQWIRGAPVRKGDWLGSLRTALQLQSDGLIFFGDVEEDAQAAREAGCLFVAVGETFSYASFLKELQK